MANIRQEIKKLTKGEDQVILEDHGIVDQDGELTEVGRQEVLARLLDQVKSDIVADLKKIDAKRKKKKC